MKIELDMPNCSLIENTPATSKDVKVFGIWDERPEGEIGGYLIGELRIYTKESGA
jgi:hypothetical protein